MVNPVPPPSSGPQGVKPFALRSTLYTLGFLFVILGIVPSICFVAEQWLRQHGMAGPSIPIFWNGLRSLVGAAVFTIGLAAYLACSAWLIYHGRGPHVEFDPPKVFVATGPYRWVRNPVVLTLLVTALGEAVFLDSVGIFLLVVAGCGFAHYQVTQIEEPRLKTRFGETYEAYCRNVPRWIPRPPANAVGL